MAGFLPPKQKRSSQGPRQQLNKKQQAAYEEGRQAFRNGQPPPLPPNMWEQNVDAANAPALPWLDSGTRSQLLRILPEFLGQKSLDEIEAFRAEQADRLHKIRFSQPKWATPELIDFFVKQLAIIDSQMEQRKAEVSRRTATHTAPLIERGPFRSGLPRPPFPALASLKWDEISISFLADDLVRIKARNVDKKFNFGQMGFTDGRKGDEPNRQWELLKVLARNSGKVSWQDNVSVPMKRDNIKAQVKDLRKLLKAFFGLNEDPFHPYRQARAYSCRFNLRDERPDRSR